MALPTNTFRRKRYFRSKFREGKYLLSAEATDIQLESYQALRDLVKNTYGDIAVGVSFKPDQLSASEIMIRPGEAWDDGIPFTMKSGTDPKVIQGILETGITFSEESATISDIGGKLLDLTGLADGNYSIVLENKEEIVRPVGTGAVDPYLEGVNVGEETENKIRLICKVNVVQTSDLTETPTYPLAVANHFVNKIVVMPSGGANFIISAVDITPDINGADRRVVFNNSLGNLPFATDADAFINGILVDSDGNYLTITSITTSDGGATVQMLLDREVAYNSSSPHAGLPIITNGIPFTLYKRDHYITSISGDPLGKHYYRIADFSISGGAISSIIDVRTVSEINSFGVDPNVRLVGGGIISWDVALNQLTFDSDFEVTLPGIAGKAIVNGPSIITLASDGEVSFIYLDREATIDYVVAPTIVDKVDVPPNVDAYILAERRYGRIYFPHGGSIGDGETGVLGAFGKTLDKDWSEDLIIDALSENQMDEVFAETFNTQAFVDLSKTIGMTYDPFAKTYTASAAARIIDYFPTVLPAADLDDPWTVLGTQSEALLGGLLHLIDSSIGDQIAYRRIESNLVTTSHNDNQFRARLTASTGTKPFFYEVYDGSKQFGLELISGAVNLIDGTGAVLQTYSINTGIFHDYRLVKLGNQVVQWYIDDVLIGAYPYASITTSTILTQIVWGTSLLATATVDIDYIALNIYGSILQSVDIFRIAGLKYEANVIPESEPTDPWILVDGVGISHVITDKKLVITDNSAVNTISWERTEPTLTFFGTSEIEMRVKLDSGASLNFEQFGIRLLDGRLDVAAYIRDDAGQLKVGMYDGASYNLVSTEFLVDFDKYIVIKLAKTRDEGLALYIDGELKDTAAYNEFVDLTTDKKMMFGGFDVASNYLAYIDYVQYVLPGDGNLAATPVKDFMSIVNSDDPYPICWISTDDGFTWYETIEGGHVSVSDLDLVGSNVIARIGLSKSGAALSDYGILYNRTNYDVRGQFEYDKQTATGGQTIFNLPFTYTTGVSELVVHYRPIATGLTRKLTLPEDYTEPNQSSVQLTFAAFAGDILEFRNSFTKDPLVPPPVRFLDHNHSGSKGESDAIIPTSVETNSFKMPTGASLGGIFTSDAFGNASWSSSIDITSFKMPTGAVAGYAFLTDLAGNASWGQVTALGLATDAVETLKIKDANVTRAKLEAVGQSISISTNAFTGSSGSYADVSGLDVRLITTGRPVMLFLQSDGSGNEAYIGVRDTSGDDVQAAFRIQRSVHLAGVWTTIANYNLFQDTPIIGSDLAIQNVPPGCIIHMDLPAAGDWDYRVQYILKNGTSVYVYYCRLVAYEL